MPGCSSATQRKRREPTNRAWPLPPVMGNCFSDWAVVGSPWGNWPQAIAALRQAAAAQPPQVYALAALGNALMLDGQAEEAEGWFRQALALAPQEGRILVNLGHCLHLQDRLEEAADCLQRAILLLPRDAQPHNNLGTILQEQNRLEGAIEAYRRGLQLAPHWPEIHYNLGTALLTLGRYEEGWREYEWRLQRQGATYPRFLSPLWTGSPLSRQTLLICAEQGLGDTLQFVRYLPLLAEAHPQAQICLRCQGSLVELFRGCPPAPGAGDLGNRSLALFRLPSALAQLAAAVGHHSGDDPGPHPLSCLSRSCRRAADPFEPLLAGRLAGAFPGADEGGAGVGQRSACPS
jgi:tetratricopeptide (TPR) repeat protein